VEQAVLTSSWLGKAGNRIGRDPDFMADVLMGFHR
jgi:hypothetical protein